MTIHLMHQSKDALVYANLMTMTKLTGDEWLIQKIWWIACQSTKMSFCQTFPKLSMHVQRFEKCISWWLSEGTPARYWYRYRFLALFPYQYRFLAIFPKFSASSGPDPLLSSSGSNLNLLPHSPLSYLYMIRTAVICNADSGSDFICPDPLRK